MPEEVEQKVDTRFDEGSFQATTFRRLEQMPREFQGKWWSVYDPKDPPEVRGLFYPAVWAAMDVADNWQRQKAERTKNV